MLEDLGKCAGNKPSAAMVQSDAIDEGLNNRQSDNQCLSGKLWGDEMDDALKNLKQRILGAPIC